MAILSCLFRLIKWLFVLCALIYFIHLWLQTKNYVFSHERLHEISSKHAGTKDVQRAMQAIHRDLLKEYPGHIMLAKDLQWGFTNAGGVMCSMCFLHGSITEYVMFYGCILDTMGHSGRYMANISDTVLSGEIRVWNEGDLTAKAYKQGDYIFHPRGNAAAVSFDAGTFMVEYARGFIPQIMSFGSADSIFSTQDFIGLFSMMRNYGKCMWMETLHCMASLQTMFQ
ncbi:hypothetical protein CAPTEDRAFT_173367, partial [Capitella teleta]